MKLYNTLGRSLQDFDPSKDHVVTIYTCGPTVYDYQHIGNYSGYIYWDILVRLLKSQGYNVKRIMNITDVGHLVSDSDEGEDKLEKGAKREGKTARQVADFYTDDFKKGMQALDLLEPEYAKATDYIPQQIEIIQKLVNQGFAYQEEQAIYFDVSKLDDYGRLTGQKLSEKEVGARDDVVADSDKRHPQDFALWFFRVGRFADHEMHWPSPWGDGFPGWHIECSAIVHTLLGDPIDIHTGGVDHIGTHHTNEIAQTEAAFGHPLAKFWLHNNHMMVDGKKISKSLGNGLTLQDLEKKDYTAMDFKMLVLQSHYRSQSNFTWETLEAAHNRLKKLRAMAVLNWQPVNQPAWLGESLNLEVIKNALSDDINTPLVLSSLSGISADLEERLLSIDDKPYFEEFISFIDKALGLDLKNEDDINTEQKQTVTLREEARKNQHWDKADELREQLEKQAIGLRDTDNGPIWYRL